VSSGSVVNPCLRVHSDADDVRRRPVIWCVLLAYSSSNMAGQKKCKSSHESSSVSKSLHMFAKIVLFTVSLPQTVNEALSHQITRQQRLTSAASLNAA